MMCDVLYIRIWFLVLICLIELRGRVFFWYFGLFFCFWFQYELCYYLVVEKQKKNVICFEMDYFIDNYFIIMFDNVLIFVYLNCFVIKWKKNVIY